MDGKLAENLHYSILQNIYKIYFILGKRSEPMKMANKRQKND
jgi:hypothetical protein